VSQDGGVGDPISSSLVIIYSYTRSKGRSAHLTDSSCELAAKEEAPVRPAGISQLGSCVVVKM
jgi:hypothetical protein